MENSDDSKQNISTITLGNELGRDFYLMRHSGCRRKSAMYKRQKTQNQTKRLEAFRMSLAD